MDQRVTRKAQPEVEAYQKFQGQLHFTRSDRISIIAKEQTNGKCMFEEVTKILQTGSEVTS